MAAQVLGGHRRDVGAGTEVQHPVRAGAGEALRDEVPAHRRDELRARDRRRQVAARAQVAPVARREDRQRERRRIGQQPGLGGELRAQQRAGLAQPGRVERHVDGQRRPAEAQRRAAASAAPALGLLGARLLGHPRAQQRERLRRAADDDPPPRVDERDRHDRAVGAADLRVDGVQQRLQPRHAHAGDRDERGLRPGLRGQRGVQAHRPRQADVAREQRVADPVGSRLRDEQRRQQPLGMPGRRHDRAGAHRLAQPVRPDRAPQQRLRDEDQRVGDRRRAQVLGGRRGGGILGPGDEVQAVAKAAAGLSRRRRGGVGEDGGGDGERGALIGPLGEERGEFRERRAALAGERHGGPPPAGLQLAEQRGGGRGHRGSGGGRSGRSNHVFGHPNLLAERRQVALPVAGCRS